MSLFQLIIVVLRKFPGRPVFHMEFWHFGLGLTVLKGASVSDEELAARH